MDKNKIKVESYIVFTTDNLEITYLGPNFWSINKHIIYLDDTPYHLGDNADYFRTVKKEEFKKVFKEEIKNHYPNVHWTEIWEELKALRKHIKKYEQRTIPESV